MSPTIETLYDAFAEKYGNVSQFPRQDSDPKYVAKKRELIRRYLKDLYSPKSDAKFYFPDLWKAFNSEVLSRDIGDMFDPLVSLVRGKVASRAHLTPGITEFWNEHFGGEARQGFAGSATAIETMFIDIGIAYSEIQNPYLKHCALQLVLICQYDIVKALQFPIADAEWIADYLFIWNERKLASMYDYKDVHPFVMQLCPPSEIWDKYVYDGKLFVRNADGTVGEAPYDADELRMSPPKLLWDPESARKPLGE